MSTQDLDEIYQTIDRRLEDHINSILRLISQTSIAAQNIGMKECASLVRELFLEAGCPKAEIFETPGQPVVYGELNYGAPLTLEVYMMYDVKQIEGQKWTLVDDPFKPKVVEMPPFKRVIVGRGQSTLWDPCRVSLYVGIRRYAWAYLSYA